MIGYEFKGGTGTASRAWKRWATPTSPARGAAEPGLAPPLAGRRRAVGKRISEQIVPSPWPAQPSSSSIIIVIGTDAPLLPHQCRRLAQRATTGLARTGGFGFATSATSSWLFPGVHPNPRAARKPPPRQTPPPTCSIWTCYPNSASTRWCSARWSGKGSHSQRPGSSRDDDRLRRPHRLRLPHDLLVEACRG